MCSSGISQKEYLKKYLSAGGDDKKKKKKKPSSKSVVNRLRIVDDDIDIHNMRPLDEGELELYELQEDAPQIAGIIDERPEEVKIKEKFGTKKWKVVADENDMGIKIIDKANPSGLNRANHDVGESNNKDLSSPRKSGKYSDELSETEKSHSSENLPNSKNNQRPNSKRNESTENFPLNKKSHRYDSDESPQRKSKKNDSDESPPRRNRKINSEDLSLHRKVENKKRNDYDSDASPPRKNKIENTPPYRRRQNYDSDESPPRRKKKSNTKGFSPHTRAQKYDSDASPPRRNTKSHMEKLHKNYSKNDSDESPPRKTKRISESPPRKEFNNKSETRTGYQGRKVSPSGPQIRGTNNYRRDKQKNDSDESPPRRERRKDSTSSPNKGKRRDSISPPKREKERKRTSRSPARNRLGRDVQEPRRSRWGESDTLTHSAQKDFSKSKTSDNMHYKERFSGNSSRKTFDKNDEKKDGRNYLSQRKSERGVSCERKAPTTSKDDSKKETLDGRKAGLVGAGELRAEIEDLKLKEKEMFEKMDVNISGRGAAPIMRDRKTGKKRDLEEEEREKQKKDEKQAERDAKYMQWGKGLKQVSDKAQKMEEDIYEMSKPLARYADDADLDNYLRYQEREGDPMLDYIRSKTKSQGSDSKSKPQYEGTFMPNRFGVRPGYRWDGVDRSNGYEKQWFETQNAKKAVEEEAYKWSTSDM